MDWAELETGRYYDYLNTIIKVRGQWAEEVLHSKRGCERHHIVLAAFKGEGDYVSQKGRTMFNRKSQHPNCIYLFPAEHFRAHQILAEDNPEEPLVLRAFWNMFVAPRHQRKNLATAEEYERVRALYIETVRGDNNIARQPEVRQKLSQNHADVSGKRNPMYGSHRVGSSNPNYGNGQKVRGALNGRAVPVVCLETGQQFGCIKDAAEWLHIQGISCNLTLLRRCSVDGQRSVGGYHWRRIDKSI